MAKKTTAVSEISAENLTSRLSGPEQNISTIKPIKYYDENFSLGPRNLILPESDSTSAEENDFNDFHVGDLATSTTVSFILWWK